MFHWFNHSGYQAWRREEGWEGKREITVRRDKLGRLLTQT